MKFQHRIWALGFLFLGTILLSNLQAAPKIGVVLKGRTGFWLEAEKGAREAAEKYGVEVLIKLPPSEDNAAAQIQMINAMAAQNIQALVIAPNDQNAVQTAVAAVAKNGVKIIVLDSPLAGNVGSVFVGTDQSAAGAAAGRLMAGFIGGNDEVVFFKASETQSGGATEQRENSAAAALRELAPSASVRGGFFAGGDPEIALTRAGRLLQKYPAAKVVFASSTTGTMALLQALEQQHLAGTIKLVGFGYNLNKDVADAIEQGKLHGWVAQQPRSAGFAAVEAAATLLKGGAVPPVLYTDYVVITKKNLHEAKIQALLSP